MLYVAHEPNKDNSGYHPIEWVCSICGKSGLVKKNGEPCCPDHPKMFDTPIYLDDSSSYDKYRIISYTDLEVISAAEFLVSVHVFHLRASREPVNGRHLIMTPVRHSKVRLSLVNGLHYQIEKNGMKVNSTKSNLIKALSNTDWYKLRDTILDPVLTCNNSQSAKFLVDWLMDHPEYEKVITPAGSTRTDFWYMYRFVYHNNDSDTLINKTASQPHEILGLGSRSLFRLIAQNVEVLGNGKVTLKMVQSMLKRFGPQVTENLLNLAMDLIRKNTRNRTRPISIQLYLDILSRDDITYDPKQLLDYVLFRVYRFQGIRNPDDALTLLRDYLNIMAKLGVKPEKYPRSLKLAHDIAMKNYHVVLNDKIEWKFEYMILSDDYQSLCMNGKDYCILAPKSMKDLVYEANSLNHCVDSYIEDVADGTAKIYFLRSTDALDTPLMTLDVRNNVLYQAAGSSNRDPSPEEKAVIKEWTEKHGIDYMCQ